MGLRAIEDLMTSLLKVPLNVLCMHVWSPRVITMLSRGTRAFRKWWRCVIAASNAVGKLLVCLNLCSCLNDVTSSTVGVVIDVCGLLGVHLAIRWSHPRRPQNFVIRRWGEVVSLVTRVGIEDNTNIFESSTIRGLRGMHSLMDKTRTL